MKKSFFNKCDRHIYDDVFNKQTGYYFSLNKEDRKFISNFLRCAYKADRKTRMKLYEDHKYIKKMLKLIKKTKEQKIKVNNKWMDFDTYLKFRHTKTTENLSFSVFKSINETRLKENFNQELERAFDDSGKTEYGDTELTDSEWIALKSIRYAENFKQDRRNDAFSHDDTSKEYQAYESINYSIDVELKKDNNHIDDFEAILDTDIEKESFLNYYKQNKVYTYVAKTLITLLDSTSNPNALDLTNYIKEWQEQHDKKELSRDDLYLRLYQMIKFLSNFKSLERDLVYLQRIFTKVYPINKTSGKIKWKLQEIT